MYRAVCSLVLIVLFCVTGFAEETARIIKVNGRYAIINKGTNQGIENNQVFLLQRGDVAGRHLTAEVRVIRTTANRAAVELVSNDAGIVLQKDDLLTVKRAPAIRFESTAPTPLTTIGNSNRDFVRAAESPKRSGIPLIREPGKVPVNAEPEETAFEKPDLRPMKQPWITLNSGVIVPGKDLGGSNAPGLKIGGSYMVEAGESVNVGIELNKTFMQGTGVSNPGVSQLSTLSSSLFEGFFVVQKFFGDYFFLETGAGLYRPKIETVNLDGVRASFSSTHFGFFGGTGVFIPTSPYAGLSIKGRLHNYFDRTTKNYFGLTGGFRFRIN